MTIFFSKLRNQYIYIRDIYIYLFYIIILLSVSTNSNKLFGFTGPSNFILVQSILILIESIKVYLIFLKKYV